MKVTQQLRALGNRGRTSLVTALFASLASLTIASFASAQNVIEDVAVAKGAAGRTTLTFSLKEQMAGAPSVFAIATPPRLVLDFANTTSIGKATNDVTDSVLRSYNVVQAQGRTRVVLNLSKSQAYDVKSDGKKLIVSLFDAPGTAVADSAPEAGRFSAAVKTDGASYGLRDVDFRRGQAGEGRIIVDLSDANSGVDIKAQGKVLIVDFLRTQVPRNLERKLDVSDFGTPVQQIDTFAQGSNTRMVIEPKGLWEHSAYQTDNRLIIEVKPIVEDPNKLTQGSRPGYKGEKLSLNFQDIAVRSVLQVIGDFTGLNIIVSDTVTGNVTLRLKDVPWDQALDLVMQARSLDMRKNGNVVWIAPKEELALKEKQELEAKAQVADIEPLRTEMFQLNYQKAEELRKILVPTASGTGASATSTGVLSKRGSVSVDARTNVLIVQDTPTKLEQVRALINRIDISVKQVMIEARVVIADDNFSRQLGARFGIGAIAMAATSALLELQVEIQIRQTYQEQAL
jgi:type IV pilus assembly protein PilQ